MGGWRGTRGRGTSRNIPPRGRRETSLPPYLIEDVVAFLAGGDLDEAVEALRRLLDEDVPASRVVALAPETHHLGRKGTVTSAEGPAAAGDGDAGDASPSFYP